MEGEVTEVTEVTASTVAAHVAAIKLWARDAKLKAKAAAVATAISTATAKRQNAMENHKKFGSTHVNHGAQGPRFIQNM